MLVASLLDIPDEVLERIVVFLELRSSQIGEPVAGPRLAVDEFFLYFDAAGVLDVNAGPDATHESPSLNAGRVSGNSRDERSLPV